MATSNTLTGLIPTLYEAMDRVSRELVGFIPASERFSSPDRVAKDQVVRVPIAESGDLESITPGATPAASGGTVLDYADIKITKSYAAPILWSGEEQLSVGEYGQYDEILARQFTSGMRKLTNQIEKDLAAEAKVSASRAYGTAGSTPFGSANDLSDIAKVRQILDDNGAPQDDLQLVIGSAAMANMRGKQSVLFKVNEAGSSDMLRNGLTDRLQGFALRNSGGIVVHTGGTGSADTVSGAHDIGDTVVAVSAFADGDYLPGDIVTIGNHKYVVLSANHTSNEITIGEPGLREAMAGSETITLLADYTPNIAMARSALILAARAPAAPEGGDSADDVMFVTDPMSGLPFEVRVYRQYRQVKYEIAMAWGVSGIKPAHTAVLVG